MFAFNVVMLVLTVCSMGGISAQEEIVEESSAEKFVVFLQDMADLQGTFLERSSTTIDKWLNKPIDEIFDQCESYNTLESKLESYGNALYEILFNSERTEHRESDDLIDMAVYLYEKLSEVFFGVENCLEEDVVHLTDEEKDMTIAIILRELSHRISYTYNLTLEDKKCVKKTYGDSMACQLQPYKLRREPLFHVLLGDLKPLYGKCEENLYLKICELAAVEKCSTHLREIKKRLLSPPGPLTCYNLEEW